MPLLHATTVSIDGRGVLILGASGSGKTSLALRLMTLGAELVADDQTELAIDGAKLIARPPERLQGLIEVRGFGILASPFRSSVTVHTVVDLDQSEGERMPPERTTTLLGMTLPLVLGGRNDHFPDGLFHFVRFGYGRVR